MFKKIFLLGLFVLLCGNALAGPPPFCYQEEDGSPSGCFKKIKFANGTITDNGDGTYSHSQAGAGGGDITDVGPDCSSGGCFVDGANDRLVFEGSTADTVESTLGATDPTVGDQTFNLPDMGAGATYTLATTASNVATATALAANGANCGAGEYPLGVDASGAVETCTDATTEIAAYAQPLEATLTDIADGTIVEDLVNTANPWADNEVADTITASSYLPLAGGTMTGELKIDETGIEGQPTDTLTDCSTFAATGGGIFYDDSEGQWKKCEDNTLTDLDTGGAETNSLEVLTTGIATTEIPIGTAADTVVYAALSGDVTMTNGGVVTIGADKVALTTDTTGGYAASTTEAGGATSLEADGVDALTEIAQGIKSAANDTSVLVVGTAGATDDCAKWDANGNLVSAGAACGTASGAPTDADYLVGTTNGSLSAEIVVGTSPGGELGGTWASPTIDDSVTTTGWVMGTFSGTTLTAGTVNIDLLDGVGAVDMDYGSADITDHTFTTDGTGTAEIVLPAGAIDSTEILDDTILEADLKAVDAASDEECLTYETTTGDFEWQTCGSGSDTNSVKEYYWPASATLPLEAADSIPPISKDAGTNVDQLAVLFDSATDECRSVTFKVPSDVASGSTITFRALWYSTATSGDVIWDFRHTSGDTEGETWDDTLTTEAAAADTVQGTTKLITVTTWTETLANTGWAANDLVTGVFCRDANAAGDTMAADAYAIGFGVEIPRA